MEIKTEADSNDITECPHDDTQTTGMFGLSDAVFSAFICPVADPEVFAGGGRLRAHKGGRVLALGRGRTSSTEFLTLKWCVFVHFYVSILKFAG